MDNLSPRPLTLSLTALCLFAIFARSKDIIQENGSFRWKITISGPGAPTKSFALDAPVEHYKLPVSEGDCSLSLLPKRMADGQGVWEQSINLSCNSFTTGTLCRQGDPRSGWASGILESRKAFIGINATCDQFDGSSFHDSLLDHLKAIARLLSPR